MKSLAQTVRGRVQGCPRIHLVKFVLCIKAEMERLLRAEPLLYRAAAAAVSQQFFCSKSRRFYFWVSRHQACGWLCSNASLFWGTCQNSWWALKLHIKVSRYLKKNYNNNNVHPKPVGKDGMMDPVRSPHLSRSGPSSPQVMALSP